jgi:amino acid permease
MESATGKNYPQFTLPGTLMAIGFALCVLPSYVALPLPYWVFWSGVLLQTVILIILIIRRKSMALSGLRPLYLPSIFCLLMSLFYLLPKLPKMIELVRIQSQKNNQLEQILKEARRRNSP